MIGWLPVVDFNTGARVSEGVSENGPRPWRAADWWFMMTASAMREDVMIRLSGRKRLAVLLVAVVSALSLACAQDAAEPTSTDMSNAGAPMAAADASPPAGREAPSAVPREPVATVNLDEIKEQAVRDLFDDQGRMVNPDQRLARIAVRYQRVHSGRGHSGRGQDRTLRSLSALWSPVFAGEQDVGPPKG